MNVTKSSFSFSDDNEYRIVALGKNGSGKSATGNSFLGSWKFFSDCSPNSVTASCQYDSATRFEKRLVYIDTPGFFDIKKPNEIIQKEIIKCIALSSPGPHVFLLIIKIDRFTPEEKETIVLYEKIFGREFWNHLIVVFTHKDKLEKTGKSLEQFISEAPYELRNVLRRNNNICIAIDNGASPEEVEAQMSELFTLITFVVGLNGEKQFTNTTYTDIEKTLLKEEDKERKSYIETLKKDIQEKLENIDINMKIAREEEQHLSSLENSSMNTEISVQAAAQSSINQLYNENENLLIEISMLKERIRRIEVESRENPEKPGVFRDIIRKFIESDTGQLTVNILKEYWPTILKWGIQSLMDYMRK